MVEYQIPDRHSQIDQDGNVTYRSLTQEEIDLFKQYQDEQFAREEEEKSALERRAELQKLLEEADPHTKRLVELLTLSGHIK